jgi:hypothetical protein
VSDENPRTHSAREIVLEFFPATPERLIPRASAYRLEAVGDDDGVDAGGADALGISAPVSEGAVAVRSREHGTLLAILEPVGRYNQRPMALCCDFCATTGPSSHLRFVRMEVEGSNGRRYRYATLCVDVNACDARRLEDTGIEKLLAKG